MFTRRAKPIRITCVRKIGVLLYYRWNLLVNLTRVLGDDGLWRNLRCQLFCWNYEICGTSDEMHSGRRFTEGSVRRIALSPHIKDNFLLLSAKVKMLFWGHNAWPSVASVLSPVVMIRIILLCLFSYSYRHLVFVFLISAAVFFLFFIVFWYAVTSEFFYPTDSMTKKKQ
jgi:hypothetical protein